MSWIRVWLHFVWSTKNRIPFLNEEIRPELFTHIRENAIEKNIHIDFINGYTDHVHLLVSLSADQKLSEISRLIKGESSFWMNKNKKVQSHFKWQDDYFVASVSHSHVNRVRNYIKKQEAHHKKMSWEGELELMKTKYGFIRKQDGLG